MKNIIKNKYLVRVSQAKAKAFLDLSKVSKFTFNKNNNTFEFKKEDWDKNKSEILKTLSKYKYMMIH